MMSYLLSVQSLIIGVPLVLYLACAYDPKRAFAWLGGVDLIALPLFLLLAPDPGALSPLAWTAPPYLLGVGLLLSVSLGWQPRDWCLPLRGRWATRLAAAVGVTLLVSVFLMPGLLELAEDPTQIALVPWWMGLLVAPVALYLYPLWDAVTRSGEKRNLASHVRVEGATGPPES